MVCEWGMSDKLGPISLGQKDEPIFLGKEIARHKDYSESTAKLIDSEISEILGSRLKRAQELLREHRDQVDIMASALLERETLGDAEIRELLGMPPRPRAPGPDKDQAA